MTTIIPIKLNQRSCDGCTKCCEGYLHGNAHGYSFHLGKSCYFVKSKGCSIYDYRPKDPCKTFVCYWKSNNFVPDKYKPSKSGIIMVYRQKENYNYLSVNFAGNDTNEEFIRWLHEIFTEKKVEHIRYYHNNKIFYISRDPNFEKSFESD